MASSLLKDYIGRGLAADRPATPAPGTGVGVIYYATDTETLSVWDGSAWDDVGGGASAWGAITGTLADQTDLAAALAGKQASGSYAAASHTHAQSDVTGLVSDLAAKEAAIAAGTTGQYWRGDKSWQTLDKTAVGLANVDNTTDAGKPVSTATQTALDAKGAKWNYATLASDFDTLLTAASDITGLAFTPAASTKYEFEIMLLLRTAAGATGPQPGLAWPTGMTDGVVRLFASSSANAEIIRHGNINAAVLVANTGMSSTTTSFMGGGNGFVIAGASPSGDVKVQLASEVAASTVTAKAGSFIRWRIIA